VTDERNESLAAQAASWVPPWERAPREPDRAYQAAATAPDISDDVDEVDGLESGLEAEDDDFDPAFEGENPPTVDAPAGMPEDSDHPTDVGVGPDLAEPAPVVAAAETAEDEDDLDGEPVDAPLSPDGDDAGDVFDQAADDDVSDDAEVDLPFAEEPAGETDAEDAGEQGADEQPLAVETVAAAAAAIPAQKRKARSPRTDEGEVDLDPEPPREPLDDAELRAALEAILLVVDEPVGELQLAQITEEPAERVAAMLDDISARYTAAGHGFDLRRAAGGWRLYTRPEYAAYVERFVLDGQSVRLTQAALETLAVVAYKQPVTRSRISAIRGVNCDGVMRTLATRGLIEECGVEPETGAHLYRTTGLFLEKLGLNSVDQLPPLAPFLPDDVEEVLDASG
jgi:segregation and condensation protein B